MTKLNQRSHQVHPPSSVSPNLAVNQKPNYVPPPEANAKQGGSLASSQPGVDPVNSRRPVAPAPTPTDALTRDRVEDVSDPDSDSYDPDDPAYDESLDDSEPEDRLRPRNSIS